MTAAQAVKAPMARPMGPAAPARAGISLVRLPRAEDSGADAAGGGGGGGLAESGESLPGGEAGGFGGGAGFIG